MDITESPTAWDESDRVEMSGMDYDLIQGRLKGATITVNKLTELFAQIKEQMKNEKRGNVIVIPEYTGGILGPQKN
jgi:hypothetical protein